MSPKSWTLQDTCCSLFPQGRGIKSVIGKGWKLEDATARFNSIQKEEPQIHAEIQLLMYLAQQESSQSSRQESNGLMYGYIGCSKKSCYLCNEFIKQYDPSFRTQGSHGALFSQWTVPHLETSGDIGGASVRIARALHQVEQNLVSLVRKDKTGKVQIAAVKQSSVGGSSCGTTLPGGKGDISEWAQLLASSHLVEERMCNMMNIRTLFEADSVAENTEVELEQQLLSSFRDDHVFSEPPAASHAVPCDSFEADYFLDLSAVRDEIPDDPDVLEKFGFMECRDYNERSFLLGLYQGLLNGLEVDVLVINSWMEDGTLKENIIKTYEERPQGNRGEYYPWFLRQAHLLNPNPEEDNTVSDAEMYLRHLDTARGRHLNLEDQGIPVEELSPWTKRESLRFFGILSMNAYPHPNMARVWFNLGFCVCHEEHHQRVLGTLYSSLVYGNKMMDDSDDALEIGQSERQPRETCSFGEFWTCFGEGRLAALMERYQLRGALEGFPYLEGFLSIPPDNPRPLVWHLRHLLELGLDANQATVIRCHEADMLGVARRKFGLDASSGRLDAKDIMILKDFYIKILEIGKEGATNPLDLERARVEGRLLEFLLQAHQATGWSRHDASEIREVLRKAFS
ncbi:Uu.00g141120.m01.CDS01 [Anthostomella pinea]|uniref:Uu.00g141120.m01.CDS01 n=1 Tax=Anthostomella pinea TaxID=933095 RepID=A0AAI8VQ61_9PEZI|nr:Uu.00g141120.m01.CDS01 [Anthostomella pinea]